MNNALALQAESSDRNEKLRIREGEIARMITLLRAVAQSEEWRSLKELLFDGLPGKLKAELLAEALKEHPSLEHLRYLSGQLTWAKKYADLEKLADVYRLELSNVKKLLYGNPDDGASSGS